MLPLKPRKTKGPWKLQDPNVDRVIPNPLMDKYPFKPFLTSKS